MGSNQSGRGGQSSVSCRGCGTLLNYATPAQSVRCILCSTVTPTAVALVGVSHLVCGSCRTIIEYPSGATSVRCSVCDAVSLTARRELTATVRCRLLHGAQLPLGRGERSLRALPSRDHGPGRYASNSGSRPAPRGAAAPDPAPERRRRIPFFSGQRGTGVRQAEQHAVRDPTPMQGGRGAV